MEVISTARFPSLYGEDLDPMKYATDSDRSSCPTTPCSSDDGLPTETLDFGDSLGWEFSGTLNASLFDGEFPNSLYTHINIKTDDDEQTWTCGQIAKLVTSLPFVDENFDGFDDNFLLEDFSTESLDSEEDGSVERKTSEISTEDSNVDNSFEATGVREDFSSSSNDFVDNTNSLWKIELRKRKALQANIEDDHAYCRVVNKPRDKIAAHSKNIDDKEASVDRFNADFESVSPTKTSEKMKGDRDKNSKYWERRRRNNLAAKRSREAKRHREISVAKKTAILEKENVNLKKQVRKLKADIKRAEKLLRSMI